MTNLEQKQNGWLEPMREWIKVASSLEKTARDGNLFNKKVAAEQVFGSNLVLANREARLRAPSGEDLSGENQWAALCAAHRFVGQKPESLILERVTGIEPVSSPWKGDIIAFIRYPQVSNILYVFRFFVNPLGSLAYYFQDGR